MSFLHPLAGEFWFDLALRGEPLAPVQLPRLSCAAGSSVTHAFRISNPTAEACALTVHNSNPASFRVAHSRGHALLELAPNGHLDLELAYTPTEIDEIERAEVALSHPRLGDWRYFAEGLGTEPGLMPPTMVTAALAQGATASSVDFRNPFSVDLELEIEVRCAAEGSQQSSARSRFDLLGKRHGVRAPAHAILQLPFSFCAYDMSECKAVVDVCATHRGRRLCWRFPLVGSVLSEPLSRPTILRATAREPLRTQLTLPTPGIPAGDPEEAFQIKLDAPPEHAAVLARTLRLSRVEGELAEDTPTAEAVVLAADTAADGHDEIDLQAGDARDTTGTKHSSFYVEWAPLRPLHTTATLELSLPSGGRWRYEMRLEAAPPVPDDVITIEAVPRERAAVSFRLANAFAREAHFDAHLSAETPAVFSLHSKASGVLSAAGEPGTLFTVGYASVEYGKREHGMLVIVSEEMQWRFELHGAVPSYTPPQPRRGLCEHTLAPQLAEALEAANHNFGKVARRSMRRDLGR